MAMFRCMSPNAMPSLAALGRRGGSGNRVVPVGQDESATGSWRIPSWQMNSREIMDGLQFGQ